MKYRNDLKKRVLAGLFAGAALCLVAPAALAANSPIPNNTLPSGGSFVAGGNNENIVTNQAANRVDITQTDVNAVIKWNSFNVGANATVNFNKEGGGQFNTLNYVTDKGGMSQIYGNINAENGNIYIVNPAGVEIGNSAQINVGSLYVSNKNLADEVLEGVTKQTNITNLIQTKGTVTNPDAVLMSLGNINANTVTFDGNRIVIDTERLKDAGGDAKLIDVENGLTIRTTNADNVVIGYDAYDEVNGYTNAKTKKFTITEIKTGESGHIAENAKEVDGYMWVEDVEQLQAIKDNLDGNYALRNSIDATATQDWADNSGTGKGFVSIGSDGEGNSFTGKFDGLDYNIFNLNIDRDTDNVGLFGVVGEGAVINNVTLVGGSITGQNNVGALAGSVETGAHISNITNSASVTGKYNVGGIVGESKGAAFTGLVNTGAIEAENSTDASNAGGLIGSMNGGTLGGASYNLGSVTGSGSNVGGLVGDAANAIIGNKGENAVTVYNHLNVTGAYNVGGIVGNMVGTTVQNAENSGNVKAEEHMDGTYYYHSDVGSAHIADASVWIANAGGIAGKASNSAFANVLNTGNVSSASDTFTETVTNVNGNGTKDVTSTYYTAGNVGGIVGSAVDTNITNATNRENEIRGAHNVGGIAGYFTNSNDNDYVKKYTIKNGINDGGDIMATGARYESSFVKETIRRNNREHFTIGNMGGIVGYMDGNNVYIESSANRGTVHTLEPEDAQYVGSASQAANAGGIVGKIDRSDTKDIAELGANYAHAAVSNSYNTGDVMGYTGIGGVAGMMYNGEIAGSYNLGNLRTTRQSRIGSTGSIDPINMGGIVGDTTEESSAQALLYDVYNKGQIGDANYDYFGRHVGGIVGRLSGTVEKAYNTGAIYNGYNVVGGIAGWMYTGSIKNSFNTGNITVYNQNDVLSQMGGIVGATGGDASLTNVYNLGTLRSFKVQSDNSGYNFGNSSLGGIIGQVRGGKASIKNAYTTGNLYINDINANGHLGSMVGHRESGNVELLTNTYYIKPETEGVFSTPNPGTGYNADETLTYDEATTDSTKWNFGFTGQNGGAITGENDWRWYKGTTPILNAFLPNSEKYFSDTKKYPDAMDGIGSIQYGTAYDPLLTIIKANDKGKIEGLSFNWQELGINNDAGLAVYGAGLTLNDFMSTGGSGYFGGLIYSEGALKLDGGTNDIHLGSVADLYGSDVTITTKGEVTSYGNIYATAEGKREDAKGNVSITGGEVNLYGKINFSRGQETSIPGIAAQEGHSTINEEEVKNPHFTMQTVGDRYAHKLNEGASGDALAGDVSITATKGDVNLYYGQEKDGLITANTLNVTAKKGNIYSDSDLAVEGDITFTAPGEKVLDLTNIGKVRAEEFMDALDKALQEQGIDINNSGEINDNQSTVETVITNILEIYEPEHFKEGDDPDDKYKAYVKEIFNSLAGKDNKNLQWLEENAPLNLLHDFLHNFGKEKQHNITFAGSTDGKITIDMWDYDVNQFDLKKYDQEMSRGASHTLRSELSDMNIFVKEKPDVATQVNPQDYVYIWVSTGEQLKGIQQYKNTHSGSNILTYNFALKNDINASGVTDYEAIGTNSQNGYTGTFDGRDNRIIGLDTTKTSNGSSQTLTNAGIFDTIGADGTVEDLRVYSGTFSGTANAGAVAGVNKGNISNVIAFGNVVDVQNTSNGASYAGGIAGTNRGTIDNVTVTGTATQSSEVTAGSAEAAAGGIAGLNDGTISNSTANSAVNSSAGDATALGGVAGVNAGTLTNVDSLGVTTGVYKVEGKDTLYSDNVGGIVGTNSGTVTNAYNESIVSGRDNVGGILGVNTATAAEGEDSPVSNVANASRVTGEANSNAAEGEDKTSDYVGGLVGDNKGSITNGRNNGEVTGNNYVGGLVGKNGAGSTLTNLVNDSAAAITGDKWVGGIAGSNAGEITASSVDEDGHVIEGNDNLINRGTITGQQYVGGVAGVNTGTIANTNNDVDLHVKDSTAVGENAPQYFGGVVGWNKPAEDDSGNPVSDEAGNPIIGTITNATNHANVSAAGASYVGGVVGKNDGTLEGMNGNYGNVTGKDFVGGVAGENTQALSGVNAVNQGNVKASDGGAGGIFAVNRGEIHDSTFSSEGEVSGTTGDGTSGTGGIFGVNVKDIVNSVLENKGYTDKDGKFHSSIVTGTSNTGGLIGINTGDVSTSSLKNEANITVTAGDGQTVENIGGLIGKNTGTITGGQDANDSGYYKYQIYNNGTITVTGKGENIGGLIGNNAQGNDKTGSLTAGYNTGVIHADGSENVGGIAGTNAGTLNQVFNTVITVNEDGSTASGSITGSTNVGGIAGRNSGTGTISNAYNTTGVTGTAEDAVTGFIAGTNSNTAGDSISNVYSTLDDKLVNSDNLVGSGTVSNVYDSEQDAFGDDDSSIHKDGEEAAENDLWRQYGDNNPLLKVFLTQLTVNEYGNEKAEGKTLDEYLNLVYNGREQDIDIAGLIEKGFITGPDGMKDEGGNSLVFNAYENTSRGPEESNPFGNSDLLYNTEGQKNAGSYDNWLASGQIVAGGDTVNNLGYDIDFSTLSDDNKINVDKATIKVTLEDIYRIYGNSQMYTDKEHTTTADGYDSFWSLGTITEVDGATDDLKKVSVIVTENSDGAVANLTPGNTTTNDVGDYNWGVTVNISEISQNYQLEGVGSTDNSGTFTGQDKSHVDRADLTISANDEQIYVGGTPTYTGTVDQFVNGDSFDVDFGLSSENSQLVNEVDTYQDVIGFWYNGSFYSQESTNLNSLFGGNYNVIFDPGTLKVMDWPADVVEPPVNEHWNFLFDDDPWGRNRDFRERKAEVHFVAGGMTL